MTEKQFKVIETITHDDRRIYELTKNDTGYYNFKGEKLLAHMICNELNGLIEKNKVLHKEIERLKRQNEDILYNNAKNMELLEKENEKFRQGIIDCLFKGNSLQIFAEEMGLIE